MNTPMATVAIHDARNEERNFAGAIVRRRATQMVKVKNIDTAVLIAMIWPNLAKSWIVVKHSGREATMVVTEELRMDEPMCETAARILQPRFSCG